MQSTTSCFSPSLWLHVVRRFWPLAMVVFVLFTGCPGLLLVNELGIGGGVPDAEVLQTLRFFLYALAVFLPVAVLVSSFVAAELVFHHLHNRKETQFYQGLPLTREALFITGTLAGLALLVVPATGALLVHLVYLSISGHPAVLVPIVHLFLVGLASTLLFFGAAALSTVVAGTALGALLIYLALNFTVVAIAMGAYTPVELLMPGIEIDLPNNSLVRWFTPAYNLPYAISGSIPPNGEQQIALSALPAARELGIYTIVGLCLMFVAGVLHRARKAYRSGDTVAFGVARTVCKALFALVVAFLAVCFSSAFNTNGMSGSVVYLLAIMLVFAALGWIAAEMIVQKTFRVFNAATFKPCCALLLLIIAACGLAWADPFNRVHYIPQPLEIEAAQIDAPYGKPIEVTGDDAVDIHQLALDNRDYMTTSSNVGNAGILHITYCLKNGSKLRRTYHFNFGEDAIGGTETSTTAKTAYIESLGAVLSKPDYLMQGLFGSGWKRIDETTLTDVTLTDYNSDVSVDEKTLGVREGMALLQAVYADAVSGNMTWAGNIAEETFGAEAVADFSWKRTPAKQGEGTVERSEEILQSAVVEIAPNMTNTMKLLNRHFS